MINKQQAKKELLPPMGDFISFMKMGLKYSFVSSIIGGDISTNRKEKNKKIRKEIKLFDVSP